MQPDDLASAIGVDGHSDYCGNRDAVWTPTDAQRRQAETMAAYGIPEADIARVLGVSKPTLRKHCGTELGR